jgi:hypothetical protein
MSKGALPPPTSVYFNFVLPELYRDQSPQQVFRMLNEDRDLFLWLVAQEIARCFTSKPADVAFVNEGRDQTDIAAALAARAIFTKKES